MESCNSGSMQSSSGCDEEYDSSKPSDHSFSNFFNSTTTPNIIPTIQPSPSSFFDPLPNYLDTSFSRSPPMDDTSWLRPPLPDHSNLIPSSLSTHPVPINTSTTAPSSSVQRPGISPASRPRNSKKRSRASRRAPTTVLTTDTANFRAMVQEFTGIPTASFMPYSSLPPPRFDLLHSLPPYLLRPFAQKLTSSKEPLEFDWQKGRAGQSHEQLGEDQRGGSTTAAAGGMDSWVLSSD
ncbi:hypothetical protein J5N97_005712 [Dioscorea zingiberensis]|uniref:VQ domain-containing protein n=1 Tax=Dioscorea zingiberensis TaxID=325984 RepID=A0A9D5D8Z3_9LILI|nr:hypothetical protein J5N97_005712 [Dioscorea zingiberensis]